MLLLLINNKTLNMSNIKYIIWSLYSYWIKYMHGYKSYIYYTVSTCKATAVAAICYTFNMYEGKGYIQVLLDPMGCKNRWQIVLNLE